MTGKWFSIIPGCSTSINRAVFSTVRWQGIQLWKCIAGPPQNGDGTSSRPADAVVHIVRANMKKTLHHPMSATSWFCFTWTWTGGLTPSPFVLASQMRISFKNQHFRKCNCWYMSHTCAAYGIIYIYVYIYVYMYIYSVYIYLQYISIYTIEYIYIYTLYYIYILHISKHVKKRGYFRHQVAQSERRPSWNHRPDKNASDFFSGDQRKQRNSTGISWDVHVSVSIYIWMWVKMEDLGDHRC